MSTQSKPSSSITPTSLGSDRTRSDQLTDTSLTVAKTAELRTRTEHLSADVKSIHGDTQEFELEELTRELVVGSTRELLAELGDELGMSWALVARVVGVTPAAVRKWRRGETVTPRLHQLVAEFVAFCRILRKREPRMEATGVGQWLETPAAARADVSHVDLYLDGHRADLLNIAAGHETGERVLDAAHAGWRDRAARARRYRVISHEDGTTTIVDASAGR